MPSSIISAWAGIITACSIVETAQVALTIARTLRNEVKSFVSYNMFYHVEHHLFPAVPTCHLPALSKRLDAVAPELRSKNVW